MTVTIGGYSPVNMVKIDNILRTQYIIPTKDIHLFLQSKDMTTGIVNFEGETFCFEVINIEIKRTMADKTTVTITYHKMTYDYLIKLMEEQNGTN